MFVQMWTVCLSPFNAVLVLTEQLQPVAREAKKIREHSQGTRQGEYQKCERILRLEEKTRRDLAAGTVRADRSMMPDCQWFG